MVKLTLKRFFKVSALRLRRLGNVGVGMLPKNKDDGAREGAEFIKQNIIHVTNKVFDDFAAAPVNQTQINQLLGI